MFDKYAPTNSDQPFEKIKKVDASRLPPCFSTLLEKIKRSNCVASMWKRATVGDSHLPEPEECGWVKENSQVSARLVHWTATIIKFTIKYRGKWISARK